MALSVTQLYEVMAQLPDPIFILSEDGYYVEYIGGMEQQSYHDGNPLAGKQLADVLPPEMAMWVKAQVAESLASGQRINRPIQVVATCPSLNGDEAMARFVLTLSIKAS